MSNAYPRFPRQTTFANKYICNIVFQNKEKVTQKYILTAILMLYPWAQLGQYRPPMWWNSYENNTRKYRSCKKIIKTFFIQKKSIGHCSERFSRQGQTTANVGDNLQGEFVFLCNLWKCQQNRLSCSSVYYVSFKMQQKKRKKKKRKEKKRKKPRKNINNENFN